MFKRAAVLVVLLSVILTGCQLTSKNNGKLGGKIVIAIPTDPDSFHPLEAVAAATVEIAWNILEGLVKATPEGSLTGALAEKWDITEEGKLYTFTLRSGIKFHNGRDMTSQDVVDCLTVLSSHPRFASEYKVVEEITAVAQSKVQIKLSSPYAPLLSNLAELSASIYPLEEENMSMAPIGTGPFKLVEWKPTQYIRLVKNTDYRIANVPYLDEAVFMIIPDTNSMAMNLITGHVDLIPRLEAELLSMIERHHDITVTSQPMNLVQLLAINNARQPLDDIRVRKAINLAINKNEIITGAAFGHGVEIGSNMSPVAGIYYKDMTSYYAQCIAEAKDLLAEAGYPDGLKLTMALPAPYPLHVKAGEIAAHQLAQIGIEVKLESLEWANWLQQVNKDRDYDLTIIGFVGKLDPHRVLGRYQSMSSRNLVNLASPEYDALIVAGVAATTEQERVEVYHRMQEILAEEAAAVFIMDPAQLVASRNHVKGFAYYPIYVIDLASIYLKNK